MNKLRVLLSCGLMVSTMHTYAMYDLHNRKASNSKNEKIYDHKTSLLNNGKQLIAMYGISYLVTSAIGQTVQKGFNITNEYNRYVHPSSGCPFTDRIKHQLCHQSAIQAPLLRTIGNYSTQLSSTCSAPFRAVSELAIFPFYFMAQLQKTIQQSETKKIASTIKNEVLIDRAIARQGILLQNLRPTILGIILPLTAMELYQRHHE